MESYEPALSPAAPPRGLASYVATYLDNQNVMGLKNACGTTSMAGILNFWSADHEYNRATVDKEIRQGDLTTSPFELARYARSQGFRSRALHKVSFEQLADLVDKGVPVQVCVKSFHYSGKLHYITAVGADRDPQGKLQGFGFADTSGAQERHLNLEEFAERWGNLRYSNIPTGIDHLAIVTLPTHPTPVKGVDGVTRDASQIAFPAARRLPWVVDLQDAYLQAANWALSLSGAHPPGLA
jgi:hypothetical protein